jgi:hypothetical protein
MQHAALSQPAGAVGWLASRAARAAADRLLLLLLLLVPRVVPRPALMSSAGIVSAEDEKEMKPMQMCEVLISELDLGVSKLDLEFGDVKPKAAVEKAAEKLGIQLLEGSSVKEQACAVRAQLRGLPASFFWGGGEPEPESEGGSEPVSSGTCDVEALKEKSQAILDMLLAKPASAGGFASGIVGVGVKGGQTAKGIDTHTVVAGGATHLDTQQVIMAGGQRSEVEHESLEMSRLFKSKKPSTRVGELTFHVEEREQLVPGTMRMKLMSTINKAKMVSLLTPHFIVIGMYEFSSAPHEEHILALMEELRLAAEAV